MARINDLDLDRLIDAGAIRLEITGGIPTWEVSPSLRHQAAIYRIQTSIKPLPDQDGECACAHYSDVQFRFKDGSMKRPDIAIFCVTPTMTDEAVTIIPQAVIEIISPGYEFKDLTLNPQFYLAQGVDDVVVVDPRSGVVTHHRTTGVAIHQAPVTINLQCGCECTVPKVE